MTSAPIARWVTPAARLSGGVILAVALATATPSVLGLGVACAFFVSVLIWAKPPARRWQKRLAFALVGSGAMLAPFALGGGWSGLAPILLRTLSAIVAAVATSLTLAGEDLGSAFATLRAPRALTTVIVHTVGQLGSLADEGQRLALARKLRGASGTGANLELLSTLLIQSAARGQRRALAVELRGASPGSTVGSFGGFGSLAFIVVCALMGISVHLVGR